MEGGRATLRGDTLWGRRAERERGLFKLVVQILRAEEGCKQSVRLRYLTWLLIVGTKVQHVD